jgi:uncharacterized protein (DUF736 family)
MAGYEHKENSGSLFRNDRKEKETHPDYKGACLVNGVKMEIAAWIKERNDGSKFMSLRFEEPRERTAAPKKPADEMDSDIPF